MNSFAVSLFVTISFALSFASSAAPSSKPDCSTLVLSMVDCLSFVSNNSTDTKPKGSCCSGLKSVLKANPDCLCEAFKNSAQLGVSLNVTKALTLPSVCHVSAPDINSCQAIDGTGAAPASSPKDAMSPKAAEGTPSIAGSTTTTAPSPSPKSSGSSALTMSLGSVLALAVTLISFA